MLKLVIFDFDDTLINTYRAFVEFIRIRCKELGIRDPGEDLIKEHWGKPYDHFHASVFPEIKNENLWDCKLRPNYSTVDGCEKMLEHCQGNGLIKGILTSRERGSTESAAKTAGLNLTDFSFLYTFNDVKNHKPYEGCFDEVFEFMDEQRMEKSEAIYVGDNFVDFEAAENNGMYFIAVTTGIRSREDFIKLGIENYRIAPNVGYLPEMDVFNH